jgi:hypothetical protein
MHQTVSGIKWWRINIGGKPLMIATISLETPAAMHDSSVPDPHNFELKSEKSFQSPGEWKC